MLKPVLRCCLLSLCLLLSVTANAGDLLYRYTDSKGGIVISRQGVPPEFISKGYDILNDQGRVVQVIAPAPTLEERQRLLKEKARASSDAQLKRLYSSPEDIDRARDRKLAELDGVISVARSNLQSVRTQQANYQAQAADFERSGRDVPESLLVQINNQKVEQKRLIDDIKRYEAVRKESEASFNADRARFAEIMSR
ncbi:MULTISPECIES: DUF4124 domain-containing protein [Pseudomonas]|uniref:Uncharacterized protein n=1 Tax=Pseudomonas segetis TaxID=298908 RepID=A0A239FUH8_9PSED|nr:MULTISPECIES: DUF4124 domain-containing protein [Pseudomonas]SNS60806.1 protein of unknown function [Pseudomonas segetis]